MWPRKSQPGLRSSHGPTEIGIGKGRLRLSLTALLVDDYDEAIAFYIGKLGFELRSDERLTP